MKGGQTYSLKHAGNCIGIRYVRSAGTFCSRRPLQRLFQEYVDEHKDEFEAESARRPPQRLFQEYVDQEPAALDKALQLAKYGARRAGNVRATPRPDVPQKDPNVRLKPDTDTHRPARASSATGGTRCS